jgi:hypothetical protein
MPAAFTSYCILFRLSHLSDLNSVIIAVWLGSFALIARTSFVRLWLMLPRFLTAFIHFRWNFDIVSNSFTALLIFTSPAKFPKNCELTWYFNPTVFFSFCLVYFIETEVIRMKCEHCLFTHCQSLPNFCLHQIMIVNIDMELCRTYSN